MAFDLDHFLAHHRHVLPGEDINKLFATPERNRTLMEMPDNLPDNLLEIIQNTLAEVEFNRYPRADDIDLESQIANWLELPVDSAVLLGNGGFPLIEQVMQCYGANRRVLLLDPDFFMYRVAASKYEAVVESHRLENDFSIGLERLLDKIDKLQPELIVLSNPHNPTSRLFDVNTIKAILTHAPGLVLIDEVYSAFADVPNALLPLLVTHPNLLLLRSFSKIGAAAIRLGFLLANQEVIDILRHWQVPFPVNTLSMMIGSLIIEHYNEIKSSIEQVVDQRRWMTEQLRRHSALTVYDSSTNFVVSRLNEQDSRGVVEKLTQQGVPAIRYQGNPLLENCVRFIIADAKNNQLTTSCVASICLQD
ncbi:pyridoxal phosphate-dependent aminotransferase [Sulfuriflexus mobilis]|uniref:pyridoxal phosphate-dependent aminotransferase n=1 Tax=Sulfuriflexus mobilis TaxID=1811807 RepID=UPI000F83ACE1|nr:aminotransferase class I/II-fold pyridoxal phosphate-dependent enzyme [Sulfuriflexus mobilis]